MNSTHADKSMANMVECWNSTYIVLYTQYLINSNNWFKKFNRLVLEAAKVFFLDFLRDSIFKWRFPVTSNQVHNLSICGAGGLFLCFLCLIFTFALLFRWRRCTAILPVPLFISVVPLLNSTLLYIIYSKTQYFKAVIHT